MVISDPFKLRLYGYALFNTAYSSWGRGVESPCLAYQNISPLFCKIKYAIEGVSLN